MKKLRMNFQYEYATLKVKKEGKEATHRHLKIKEDVIEAIKRDGNSLEFVNDIFRRERDVLLEAILKTPEALNLQSHL